MNEFIKKASLLVAIALLSAVGDVLLAKLQVVGIDGELKELTR